LGSSFFEKILAGIGRISFFVEIIDIC